MVRRANRPEVPTRAPEEDGRRHVICGSRCAQGRGGRPGLAERPPRCAFALSSGMRGYPASFRRNSLIPSTCGRETPESVPPPRQSSEPASVEEPRRRKGPDGRGWTGFPLSGRATRPADAGAHGAFRRRRQGSRSSSRWPRVFGSASWNERSCRTSARSTRIEPPSRSTASHVRPRTSPRLRPLESQHEQRPEPLALRRIEELPHFARREARTGPSYPRALSDQVGRPVPISRALDRVQRTWV